jgi:hypothetical protein
LKTCKFVLIVFFKSFLNSFKSSEVHPPLLLSRLLVIFDYIMHNFFEPSNELLDKIKKVLTIESTNSSAGLKKILSNDGENYIDSLERSFQIERQKLILNPIYQQIVFQPRFYLISKTKTKNLESSQETKLDGIAVNILISSNSVVSKNKEDVVKLKLDYNHFYECLLKLLDAGIRLVDKKLTITLEVIFLLKIF